MLKRLRKAHPILFCVLAEVIFLASLFVTDLVFTIALVLFRTDFAINDSLQIEDGIFVCRLKIHLENIRS